MLALTHSYGSPLNRSTISPSPFSSHRAALLPALQTTTALEDPLTSSRASDYCTFPLTSERPPRYWVCPDYTRCARLFQTLTQTVPCRYGRKLSKLGKRSVHTGHLRVELASHRRPVYPRLASSTPRKSSRLRRA